MTIQILVCVIILTCEWPVCGDKRNTGIISKESDIFTSMCQRFSEWIVLMVSKEWNFHQPLALVKQCRSITCHVFTTYPFVPLTLSECITIQWYLMPFRTWNIYSIQRFASFHPNTVVTRWFNAPVVALLVPSMIHRSCDVDFTGI